MPNVQQKTPDDRQRKCPKHVEFFDKIKFGKFVRLVGFIEKKFITMHGHMDVKIVKTMCGSDEPRPYPERSSPTRLSTTGRASYKGRSCISR